MTVSFSYERQKNRLGADNQRLIVTATWDSTDRFNGRSVTLTFHMNDVNANVSEDTIDRFLEDAIQLEVFGLDLAGAEQKLSR